MQGRRNSIANALQLRNSNDMEYMHIFIEELRKCYSDKPVSTEEAEYC